MFTVQYVSVPHTWSYRNECHSHITQILLKTIFCVSLSHTKTSRGRKRCTTFTYNLTNSSKQSTRMRNTWSIYQGNLSSKICCSTCFSLAGNSFHFILTERKLIIYPVLLWKQKIKNCINRISYLDENSVTKTSYLPARGKTDKETHEWFYNTDILSFFSPFLHLNDSSMCKIPCIISAQIWNRIQRGILQNGNLYEKKKSTNIENSSGNNI